MVYNPPRELLNQNNKTYGYGSIYRISPKHSQEEWRRRLMQTDARYIFAFGDDDEVSGRYLGKIPGYDGPTPGRSDLLKVYIRTNNLIH
jgi:hypothetical protein